MEEKILFDIYNSVENGESAALAMITQENGSAPRKQGSIMAVWQDGRIQGSVGGGSVEGAVIKLAVRCIEDREDKQFEYNLSDTGNLGMNCGGEVKGFIKVFYPRPRLLIAGGGHIGLKLNELAKALDFSTVVFDDRDEFANKDRFVDADEIIKGEIGEQLKNYPVTGKDYIVIVTRGHLQDKDALREAVKKKPAYIGMIGSTKKTKTIMEALIEEGIDEKLLRKVYTPIGLDIGNSLPAEIALGILGEILLVKNKGTLNHRKDLRKVWG